MNENLEEKAIQDAYVEIRRFCNKSKEGQYFLAVFTNFLLSVEFSEVLYSIDSVSKRIVIFVKYHNSKKGHIVRMLQYVSGAEDFVGIDCKLKDFGVLLGVDLEEPDNKIIHPTIVSAKANKIIRDSLIDKALEDGDKEAFMELTSDGWKDYIISRTEASLGNPDE